MSRLKVKTPADGAAGSPGNAIESAGQSGAIGVEEFDAVTVEITGITTGTVQVQSSLDGSTWVNEGSALTGDGRVVVTGLATHVRANVTVDTDVAVLIKAAGRLVQGHA